MWLRCAGAALMFGLGLTGARAEVLTYAIELRGANEVPPNDSPGTGHADVTFDTATRALTWRVTYAGLTGPVIGMHFHGSTLPGQNAGILLPFRGDLASPITGSAVLTEAQAADLVGGKWYMNAHTSRHPGGELRGQVSR
jgi:hypothetical protein